MPRSIIGVIGGSGVYDLPGLADVRRQKLSTPFGDPSDEYLLGRLGDQELAFLPRHGRGHRLTPTEVNARANIHGFKQLGARRLISISAVGSMKEEIVPGHLVFPDQFIDRTVLRPKSFFGEGLVAHVGFSDPVCGQLRGHLVKAAASAQAIAHDGGTYLCIEGPQFSTRAESLLYRSWGIAVIGMTAMPEARLAREAELCYATVALATDYDCWHQDHDAVSVAQVIATVQKNAAMAREVIKRAAETSDAIADYNCSCGRALDSAVMTAPNLIPAATREKLSLLLGSRFSA